MGKYYDNAQEEGGAMMIGGMGLIIAIMIMAMMMDFGLYYNSYRKLKSASDFVTEEMEQMLPYYAYSGDYVETFNRSLDTALDCYGYNADNVVKSEIDRFTERDMGWSITVYIDIELKDEYKPMFASIIGINEIPVQVFTKIKQPMNIGEPYYDGHPYEVWGEDNKDS